MNNTLVVTLTVDDLMSIIKDSVRAEIMKAVPAPLDKLNTPQETALRLRCSLPTLAAYRKNGQIQETRYGMKKVFYKDSHIEAALKTIKKYSKLSVA